MARARGLDLTDHGDHRPAGGLRTCDAVLSSFRARRLRGPRHGRADPARARRDRPGDAGAGRVLHGAAGDQRAARTSAPRWRRSARTRGSSTTPTRSTSSPRRSTHHSPIKLVSLCEGPIYFVDELARDRGARPESGSKATMVGLNHGCWSVDAHVRRRRSDPPPRGGMGAAAGRPRAHRRGTRASLQLAATMELVPAEYFMYYYFRDEVVSGAAGQADHPRRGHHGWAPVPTGATTEEQAQSRRSAPRPRPLARRHPRARAGDRRDGRDLQRQGRGAPGQRPEPRRRAARLPGRPRGRGARAAAIAAGSSRCPPSPCRATSAGWSRCSGEYQALAAEAAWSGARRDAVRALAANPLVMQLDLAERLYDELAGRPPAATCRIVSPPDGPSLLLRCRRWQHEDRRAGRCARRHHHRQRPRRLLGLYNSASIGPP